MSTKQKIAFLLGSFDPIHIGHLCMATEALNTKLVDEVVFVPAFQNPWKKGSVDFWRRCQMVQFAVADLEHCSISDIESLSNPPYYSYDSLYNLSTQYAGNDLYLIVGSDIVNDIPNWYKGDWILENFKLLVVARPGFAYDKIDIHKYLNISSTELRQMYRENKQVYPLVPKIIDEFIKQNKIYN